MLALKFARLTSLIPVCFFSSNIYATVTNDNYDPARSTRHYLNTTLKQNEQLKNNFLNFFINESSTLRINFTDKNNNGIEVPAFITEKFAMAFTR